MGTNFVILFLDLYIMVTVYAEDIKLVNISIIVIIMDAYDIEICLVVMENLIHMV
jgi:hypothetical protein